MGLLYQQTVLFDCPTFCDATPYRARFNAIMQGITDSHEIISKRAVHEKVLLVPGSAFFPRNAGWTCGGVHVVVCMWWLACGGLHVVVFEKHL